MPTNWQTAKAVLDLIFDAAQRYAEPGLLRYPLLRLMS